jgi:NH3-dependent NAD+ synthetase
MQREKSLYQLSELMLVTPGIESRSKQKLNDISIQNSLAVKLTDVYSLDYTVPTETVKSELYEDEEEDEDEEEYINVVPEDKIINQLLQHRPSMNDVEQEFEEERQRRMYNMLRHSSHYKKIQV